MLLNGKKNIKNKRETKTRKIETQNFYSLISS